MGFHTILTGLDQVASKMENHWQEGWQQMWACGLHMVGVYCFANWKEVYVGAVLFLVVIARRTSCSLDPSRSWPLKAVLFNLSWFRGGFSTHHTYYKISSEIPKCAS